MLSPFPIAPTDVITSTDATTAYYHILNKAGASLVRVPGCCGLAGNFGMERGHRELSVLVARSHLLPAVEAARESASPPGATHRVSAWAGLRPRRASTARTGRHRHP